MSYKITKKDIESSEKDNIIQYVGTLRQTHGCLVYKIDNLVQSSLSSSLVLTLIQDFFL